MSVNAWATRVIACGERSLFLDSNGIVWGWGRLGGLVRSSTIPVKLVDNVTAVSCSNSQIEFMDKEGKLFGWAADTGWRSADQLHFITDREKRSANAEKIFVS